MVMSVWTGLGLVPVVHTVGTQVMGQVIGKSPNSQSHIFGGVDGILYVGSQSRNPGCFKETDLVCLFKKCRTRVTVS